VSGATPSVGEVYGHYRLLEQIGAGGMGVVFRAHDEQLRRDVALKIITTHLFADEASRERFRREALAVGRLNHPHIAMAFDFGEEGGVDYLVTEYVPGVSLEDKIGKEPLPQAMVLELGVELLSGLEAAHREGVIHRDLKPANVRLTREGQLKILDFGLAKISDPIDENAETAGITSGLAVTGTLPYMAPELLRGEAVDARADIFAAGAVLYEMATGKRAFPDKQPSLLIDAILHYDPVRPTLINPEVSAQLEAIILRALERDRDHRYLSATEMRADLMHLRAGESISSTTLGRTERHKSAARTHRRKLALGIVALLVAGIGLGVLLKHWWPAAKQKQRILAVLPIDTVGQDSATNALGLGLIETLTSKLAQASDSDFIQVVSPRDVRDQKVTTAEAARHEFGADLVLESSLQQDGSTIRVNSFLVDAVTHRQIAARTITVDANDSFGLQDQVVTETLDMLPAQIGPEQRRKLVVHPDTQPAAYEAYIRGRGYQLEFSKPEDIDNAVREFSKAIQIDPNYALAYAALGKTYWAGFEEFAKGAEWIVKASRSCDKALSLNGELVEAHVCLGNVYNSNGKYDQATEEFQRALKTEPGSEDALRGLADAYNNLGNFAKAESTYKQVIALRPRYWAGYSWLGKFYFGQNRYADAAEMFLKVTQLAPNNYLGFFDLAGCYIMQGRYADAVDAAQRSIALRATADAYNDLGYAYMLMNRRADAVTAVQEALKLDDHDWMTWGNYGDALYWTEGRRSEAGAKYRKAISLAQPDLGVNPKDALTLAYVADFNAMVGEEQKALDCIDKALKLEPQNGEVLFRAALVYNHFNQSDTALAYLQKAVQAGYSRAMIRDVPDFAHLRDDAQFRSLTASTATTARP
jgi:serine/threonine protein kinase/tetratricopeptide (TPR) repeat protein